MPEEELWLPCQARASCKGLGALCLESLILPRHSQGSATVASVRWGGVWWHGLRGRQRT